MTSSDFGYKFFERELNRIQGLEAPEPAAAAEPVQRSLLYGPRQRQTQFNLDLSSELPFPGTAGVLDWRRSQVLPQVFDFLGRAGVDNEILERDRAEQRQQRQRRERDRAQRRVLSEQTNRFSSGPTPTVNTQILDSDIYNQYIQEPITGLNREIRNAQVLDEVRATDELIQGLDELTRKYPELTSLLQDQEQNQNQNRSRRIRGKDFAPYMQYADTEQMYSDPGDRADLYNRLQNTETGKLYNFAEIESRYVSGDPELQSAARQDLLRAGATEAELSSIETPAFQQNRPVVGGGGYLPLSGNEAAEYISDRSRAYNELIDRAYLNPGTLAAVRQVYPGLTTGNRGGGVASFSYDEDDFVRKYPGLDSDLYRAQVHKNRNSGRLLEIDDLGPDVEVSRNALRFLRDFPVFAPQSISFMTGTPGRGLGFATDDIPDDIRNQMQKFVMDEALSNNRAGTILENSPLGSYDLIDKALAEGKNTSTSSYLRKANPFIEKDVQPPNFRGLTYSGAGFGPVDENNLQFSYVDAEGNMVPLQISKADRPLKGSVRPRGKEFVSTPALPASASPRYYGTLLPGVTPADVNRIAGNIRRTPSSLLPGLSDLIPSKEAVRRGYEEGPQAMGEQMAIDFAAGLPLAVTLAPILSTPALAPFAPGIGLGFVTTAAGESLNEATKQQTGKSLVQRIQETAGAVGGDTTVIGKPRQPLRRPQSNYVTPEITQMSPQAVREMKEKVQRQANENEFQRRLRLAEEARQQDPWDFGVTELLFGR